MLMRSSKFKALTFLPLRQVCFLGGDKPVKSGFSQAPFYCFYTDLKVESGLYLLSALKAVRYCCSNDEAVGLFQCASAASWSSRIFQSAIFRPVGLNNSADGTHRPLNNSVGGTHRPPCQVAYLALKNTFSTILLRSWIGTLFGMLPQQEKGLNFATVQ
ncbi:hypothetical protein MRX96_044287 [Rhipicephalus microplus]